MENESVPRYLAFISYSSKDRHEAVRLHRQLERFRIPRALVGRPGRDVPVPRSLFPIFRDRDELPLSADIGTSIEDALRASRYLIVLCSPDAAGSHWVNEEVRYFKSLGHDDRILAIILRGEPNASDHPAAAAAECFPPALRHRVDAAGQLTAERAEPIAGDLRPGGDGPRAVLLKAVAGIIGVGYNALARRELTRRRWQLAFLVLFLSALIGGGFSWWNYVRPRVAFYAGIGDRWGVPEGLLPVDRASLPHRETSYRVETSRSKVRQIERVNSAEQLRDGPEDEFRAAVRKVAYRESGEIERIDWSDHNGRIVLRQHFSERTKERPEHRIDFQRAATGSPVGSAGGFGKLDRTAPGDLTAQLLAQFLQTYTEITRLRVRYNAAGRPETAVFCNAYDAERANADRIFGQKFTYDARGLREQVTALDRGGQPGTDGRGVQTVHVGRDARGQIGRAHV